MIFTVAIIVLVPVQTWAQSSGGFDAALDREMPAFLDRYGVSGSVVAFIDDGAVAWTNAYGLSDVSEGTPMSPDMVFEFGSCGKVLTAWATMRLVEEGLVDLDAPVNDYLKRWQIESDIYDPDEVTVRRLLTHTSGLNMHGYLDYSPRRSNPPDLVDSLQGINLLDGLGETIGSGRLSFGDLRLVQEPGSGFLYSGGGYALLQMLIEDVTGRSFDEFMKAEVTDPLGARSLSWAWTPELQARAPTPYSEEGRPVEHRQLAIHGIGSEIGTVTDFAHFVAAVIEGPNGEPRGRGVLEPETVDLMISPWSEAYADQGIEQGLGYGLGRINGALTVSHGGANVGWMALFFLDTVRRQGFVVASPSNRADPLHTTITDLWLDATYGGGIANEWPPAPGIGPVSLLFLALAGALTLMLAVGVFRFVRELRAGRRERASRPTGREVLRVVPWLAALSFTWYTIYSSLPLYLPGWYPDFWPTIGSLVFVLILAGGIVFAVVRAFFPRNDMAAQVGAG